MKNFISIIIVNWNSDIQLSKCIESIKSYNNNFIPIIIIDNCSVDDSLNLVRHHKDLFIFESEINYGFAKACNLGASFANSEYLLFLNPDTILFDNTLKDLINYLEHINNSNFGIFGIQLIDTSNNISRCCVNFPTPLKIIFQSVGIDRIFRSFSHFMIDWDHLDTKVVDQVIGAFFIVKRDLFLELDGFDEGFFMYYEELDFSYRAYLLGWSTLYISHIKAFHAGGGSSNKIKSKRLFYALRSKIIYSFKHFTLLEALFISFITLFFEPMSRVAISLLSKNFFSEIKQIFIAYYLLFFWIIFNKTLKKND